jgi:hypothetical protein
VRWGHSVRESTAACGEVFVYFKHEESGKGPEFGRILVDSLGPDAVNAAGAQ